MGECAERCSSPRSRSKLGKLRVLSGAEVCALLSKHGFEEVRRRGSHIVMQKRTATSTITVPVPDHKELRLGTLQSIIRQSRLRRELFEARS
jgi:predicted RNA binding protein YcfA (HicA-like mRNA interferase family)